MHWLDPFILVLLIYAPAFIANGTPVVIKNVPFMRSWTWPIWPSVLGANKTWRGLVFGVLSAAFAGIVLLFVAPLDPAFSVFVEGFSPAEFVGFCSWLGFAALFGDMAESAVKRRMGHPPGARWMPWDGIDYVLAALVLALPWYVPTTSQALFILLLGPVLSGIFNMISFLMGWKKVPY
ncbi:MAG TPA: CDP-archaeol synthase [bacterium]|nr:CDP-archaeol synthase [bacterium]